MAIHTKVGILTHVPGSSASVTPGLIDGLYADYLTKEIDFMDNPVTYPKREWFTASSRAYIGTDSWEDLGTYYRGWRDQYQQKENNYWHVRSVRAPFEYENFVKDPAPFSNNGNGSNPLELIRVVSPAPNGDFNIPYPNPTGSEHYMYYNATSPLLHNRTKYRIPLVEAAYSYSTDETFAIEDQVQVRDNQVAIDNKQSEITNVETQKSVAVDALTTKHLELQGLIDSSADQPLIDAAQFEVDTLTAQVNAFDEQLVILNSELSDLQNASIWIYDTKDGRLSRYRDGRARWVYLANKDEEELTPEEVAEMEYLETNDRVLFATGDVYASMWSDERFAPNYYDNYSYLTNHPLGTMPIDVLPGITDVNILPAVQNSSLLPSVGNPGDVIRVVNEGDDYAWDPQNQEWSIGFMNRFLGDLMTKSRAKRSSYLMAKRDLEFSMKPVEFAGFFIPAFVITSDATYETLQA